MSDYNKTGGSAFPHSHLGISHGQLSYEDSSYVDGMTLRDYFAAKAMRALLSLLGAGWEPPAVAAAAFAYADAMLERRQQK